MFQVRIPAVALRVRWLEQTIAPQASVNLSLGLTRRQYLTATRPQARVTSIPTLMSMVFAYQDHCAVRSETQVEMDATLTTQVWFCTWTVLNIIRFPPRMLQTWSVACKLNCTYPWTENDMLNETRGSKHAWGQKARIDQQNQREVAGSSPHSGSGNRERSSEEGTMDKMRARVRSDHAISTTTLPPKLTFCSTVRNLEPCESYQLIKWLSKLATAVMAGSRICARDGKPADSSKTWWVLQKRRN